MIKIIQIISLLYFLYFCKTNELFYYKIATTIYFFNLNKIVSNNNYRITISLLADTIIYKNNLHIKKGNFRLWLNTVLSYIYLYNKEEDELKFYYYYYLFTICSNFYPNKFKNIIIILFVFLIFLYIPFILSYINMILSLYNISKNISKYLFTKNKNYSKLFLYLIDNIFYIEKFLIPKNNVILYPIYYIIFIIYKNYQAKLC